MLVNVDGLFSAHFVMAERHLFSLMAEPMLERLADLCVLSFSMPPCDASQHWSTSIQGQVSLLLEVKPGVGLTTISFAC